MWPQGHCIIFRVKGSLALKFNPRISSIRVAPRETLLWIYLDVDMVVIVSAAATSLLPLHPSPISGQWPPFLLHHRRLLLFLPFRPLCRLLLTAQSSPASSAPLTPYPNLTPPDHFLLLLLSFGILSQTSPGPLLSQLLHLSISKNHLSMNKNHLQRQTQLEMTTAATMVRFPIIILC